MWGCCRRTTSSSRATWRSRWISVDLGKHNSPTGKEKRILVDPLWLKLIATKPAAPSFKDPMDFPASPDRLSPRPKYGTIKTSRKWNDLAQPHPAVTNLARQHSAALSRFALEQQMLLRRSKSCGEGRSSAPSNDFIDILSRRPSIESADTDGAFAIYQPSEEDNSFKDPGEAYDIEDDDEEDIDKCKMSSVSRADSLEKFDCGSWMSSSQGVGGNEDDGGRAEEELGEVEHEQVAWVINVESACEILDVHVLSGVAIFHLHHSGQDHGLDAGEHIW
ncbi:hypothetical protein Cni_G01950 [Canna indica]|uniref:Uncharacterized protein n=1 Tax=Canna indica TaxID=4628 RepID=A0AAQ3PZ28_9LILI|nr:hypothetical protein Cni_G01950 [Canna indica]